MDISSLVRNVVAAFDDAVNLVRRIQDRKDVKDDPQAIADLVTSLSLGPVVIRGYFDSDVKRFGDAYTVGDPLAREQLKDVLISLQMSLLTTLRTVLLDEQELDYNTLLETSDNCRVNAGVCLGQLSQRLAEHARIYSQNPPAYMSPGTYLGGLHYSSSQSTHSSSNTNKRTPDPNIGQFAGLNLNTQSYLDSSSPGEIVRPRPGQKDSYDSNSWGSGNLKSFYHEQDPETRSMRRPSSHALAPEDLSLLSPLGPPSEAAASDQDRQDSLPGAQNLLRESYMTLGPLPKDSGSTRDSNTSDVSAPSVQNVQSPSRDRYGPDDYSPVTTVHASGPPRAFGSLYQRQPSAGNVRQPNFSYANRGYSGLEPMATLTSVPQFPQYSFPNTFQQQPNPNGYQQQQPNSNVYIQQQPNMNGYSRAESVTSPTMPTRKPIPSAYPTTQVQDLYNNMQRPSVSAPIPVHTDQQHFSVASNSSSPRTQFAMRPRNDSNSTRSDPRSPPPGRSTPSTPRMPNPASPADETSLRHTSTVTTYTSNTSIPRSIPPPPATGPLNLPTEKNTLGLCKGAFRLFVGIEKKAFASAQRPMGYSGFLQYWRCEKCQFEGPMAHITVQPPGSKKAKAEKCFDKTIREMYGVRYRWAFLAKCHVHLKSIPPDGPSRKDGSFGSFGCLFCAAEGHLRSWTLPAPNSLGASDAASMRSNSSAGLSTASGGSKDNAPIFGNLQSFMEHLHKHRSEDWWPNSEMLNRMKCVVGQVAEKSEDWEVNLMPLSATNGA